VADADSDVGGVPDFSIEVVRGDAGTQLIVSGELDLSVREPLEQALEAAVTAGGEIVLDLASVSFVDSSGIGALVRVAREGVSLSVINAQPAVLRALEISGVDTIITIRAAAIADEGGDEHT
jgi:anti-sigma B factor antagonist